MEQYARVGLIGKHPGFGDFLRVGLSEPVADGLEQWLDATLPAIRDNLGNDWGAFWDGSQDLRFWIGRAVLGSTLVGIMRPWRDRVGRRFPLILAVEAADVAAPVVDTDQTIWDAIAAHLEVMKAGKGGMSLLSDLHLIVPAEAQEATQTGPTLWAHHPEGDLEALLNSAASVDQDRARLNRSYWWAPATLGRTAVWLGCPGLPGPQSLSWLLAGVPTTVQNEETK